MDGGEPPRTSRRLFLRRAGALTLGLGTLGVGQWLNLRGAFDHRNAVRDGKARMDAGWQDALPKGQAAFVHLGHSTHLLQLGAARVLTDPWFFDPGHGGMWHARGPALDATQLGSLDVIVITHEHPDHADPKALDRMDKRALVIVPTPELETRVRALGFREVELLPPWRTLSRGDLSVSAVPALHDVYEIGFVLTHGAHRVFFAGDTGLHDGLPAIAERFAPTTAILPVDGTRLRTEERLVMNPEDAVRATRILKPQLVLTSHADGRFSDPVLSLLATQVKDAAARFERLLAVSGLPTRCELPGVGGRVVLPAAT
jgi:L-ascorbate metabolism protein UlaG (beta-lactamase superfamily)